MCTNFARRCLLFFIGAPIAVVALFWIQQRAERYHRKPISVYVSVIDSSGRIIPDAALITHERSRYFLIPIPPFSFFLPSWMTNYSRRFTPTDAFGKAVIQYRQDILQLDGILLNGKETKRFTVKFTGLNGRSSNYEGYFTELYAIYPAYRLDCLITLLPDERQ